jgi:hypothetical protein
MKKALVAVVLTVTTLSAFAACPFGTAYRCYQGVNGKMICGCF